jgi:hypothetical protein
MVLLIGLELVLVLVMAMVMVMVLSTVHHRGTALGPKRLPPYDEPAREQRLWC